MQTRNSRSFRNKQRGGSTLETLPSNRNTPIAYEASKYNSMSGTKVGGRRHMKSRHIKRPHSKRRRGGNPAFVAPAVLLAAQKLVQQNGLGL